MRLSRKRENKERRGLRNKLLNHIYEKCEEEGDKSCSHTVKKKTGYVHREEGWRVSGRRAGQETSKRHRQER